MEPKYSNCLLELKQKNILVAAGIEPFLLRFAIFGYLVFGPTICKAFKAG